MAQIQPRPSTWFTFDTQIKSKPETLNPKSPNSKPQLPNPPRSKSQYAKPEKAKPQTPKPKPQKKHECRAEPPTLEP